MRFPWLAYAVVSALAVALPRLGPIAKERFFPIRTDQHIRNVERTADRLCWTWKSYKARDKVSDNLDLFIDIEGLPGAVGAPFEKDTGMPWVSTRAVPAGQWHWQSFCVLLPPYVLPGTPIRIRQVAQYPGFLGLWHVRVAIPDVIDPAIAVNP